MLSTASKKCMQLPPKKKGKEKQLDCAVQHAFTCFQAPFFFCFLYRTCVLLCDITNMLQNVRKDPYYCSEKKGPYPLSCPYLTPGLFLILCTGTTARSRYVRECGLMKRIRRKDLISPPLFLTQTSLTHCLGTVQTMRLNRAVFHPCVVYTVQH